MLEVIEGVLKLITPRPGFDSVRLSRKQLRLEQKKLRVAERMYRQIKKDFLEDGDLDYQETRILEELEQRILKRKMELI